MKQRDLQDKENKFWTCVEAFSGVLSEESAELNDKITADEGRVTVVCTPSGGAKSVRLSLAANWFDELSDDELLKEIENEKG